MIVINTEDSAQLRGFRSKQLSAEFLLSQIPENGARVPLIKGVVGVGKSTALDDIIDTALKTRRYDLIVVLAPTHKIIRERRIVKSNPGGLAYRHLQKRPAEQCGEFRNRRWEHFEDNNMSLLAKHVICKECPDYGGCPWPTQVSSDLKGVQVIFAPQAYLNVMSNFIQHITRSSGAKQVLLVLDEIDFSRVTFRKSIGAKSIHQHIEILNLVPVRSDEVFRKEILETITQLKMILDSKGIGVNIDPDKFYAHTGLALEVQRIGWERFGENYSYIGFELEQLAYSPVKSRVFTPDGSVSFSSVPSLGCHVIIFSATAIPKLLAHRLDREIIPVFHDHIFEHNDTTWYNIVSNMGMAKYFPGNKSRILDAFAKLIIRRIKGGKKVLLICKKDQRDTCIEMLNANFKLLRAKKLSVTVAEDWIKMPEKSRKNAIPLLHYGVIGINDFETFDCAFCLMGYYLPNGFISDYFQEMYQDNNRMPITIETIDKAPYRVVCPEKEQDVIYKDYLMLGQEVLAQEEIGAVIQAVGRTRPFTNKREIILFQCGIIPGVRNIKTFFTLEEFRIFFEITSVRQASVDNKYNRIQKLRGRGCTQRETSKITRLSLRTVKRYWKNTG